MKKRLIYLISALFAFASCITNDLPYPVVVPNVVSVEVEGAGFYAPIKAEFVSDEDKDIFFTLLKSYLK